MMGREGKRNGGGSVEGLFGPAGEGGGGGRLIPTRALLRCRSRRRVLEKVRSALRFFPELEGAAIRVGLTRTARGYAAVGEDAIWMNPHRLTHLTVAHELVHLVQNRRLIPGGEKTADLYSLARHGALVDDRPGYLAVPEKPAELEGPAGAPYRGLLHRAAREAIARSGGSPRRAIRLFERTVRDRWPAAAEEPAGAGRPGGNAPPTLFDSPGGREKGAAEIPPRPVDRYRPFSVNPRREASPSP